MSDENPNIKQGKIGNNFNKSNMNKISIQSPEIQVHFITTDKLLDSQERQDKLHIQMLRVNTAYKRSTIEAVLNMSKQELCQFFQNYQTMPISNFSLQSLEQLGKAKLIKNNGRIYFGEVINRQMSGFGVYYSQSSLYEGNFGANRKEGVGCQIYETGNLYIGSFLNNKKHGSGAFYWFNQSLGTQKGIIEFYEGQWWGGLPDGKGFMRKINGDVYQGTFKNGLKHGFGREQFCNGDRYKGQYVNGLPQGIGQYNWADGSSYNGDFKQGMRNGFGYWKLQQTIPTDKYEGNYCMDHKSGYGEYTWSNGWCYKGNFQCDHREGYGQLFSKQKCVYRGLWKKGTKLKFQSPINKIRYSKADLTRQMSLTSQRQSAETQEINKSINIDDGQENGMVQHQLLPRPGHLIHRRKSIKISRQNLVGKERKCNHKESQSTLCSRVGTEIQRPILRGQLSACGKVKL